MTRTKSTVLLALACTTAMSAATARGIERLSAGATGCPAEVAAAKAEAGAEKPEAAQAGTAKPESTPVLGKSTVRGNDPAGTGNRLQAPRWHSFLPGMFR